MHKTCITRCFLPSLENSPFIPNLTRYALLSLVGNLHDLLAVLQSHAGRVLLGGDSTGLGVVLDESNTAATRHSTDFAEALEAGEDGSEVVLAKVVGQVLNEKDAVGRQVLVGHNSSWSLAGSLEAGAALVLGRARIGGGTLKRALEAVLLFGDFEGSLLVCNG